MFPLSRCRYCICQTGHGLGLVVGLEPSQLLAPLNRAVGTVRHASGSNPGAKVHQVVTPSKNLYYAMANNNNNYYSSMTGKNDDPRPLVIILGWLFSQKKHMMKYAEFYTQLGFDVLFTSLQGRQLIWPSSGSQVVAKEILWFLAGNNRQYDSILVHGFSIGGYLWGETLVEMCRHPTKYPDLRRLVKGHIWDSMVDWCGPPLGPSMAMFPRSRILQKLTEKSIELFTWTFSNDTRRHYKESRRLFHHTPIMSPILYLGSMDDPIGTFDMLMDSAKTLVQNGNQVFVKTWPSSPHVTHYLQHKEEYEREVLKFLNFLRFLTVDQRDVSSCPLKQRMSGQLLHHRQD